MSGLFLYKKKGGSGMKKELELYLHIPFCVRKCAYCDFLSGPSDDKTIEKYVEILIKEIKANDELAKEYVVTTIFLGGGTPSILSGEQMTRIFTALHETFDIVQDAEITTEANPGTVSEEKLSAYRKVGINRISFGLQSANNEDLKLLGRIHTYEEFLESFQMARTCGFDNINVDLISAIPKQNVNGWLLSLKKIVALNPEHISAYSLIIEEGTPFAKLYGEGTEGEKELPSEEEEREIYKQTEILLKEAGYERYEISNYAKPGAECRHNLGYWERKEYLGLGLGASSLIKNERFHNIEDLESYMEHGWELNEIRQDKEVLDETAQLEEYVFLGMRKMNGILMKDVLLERYGDNIDRMEEQGLLEIKDGKMKLTRAGIDVSNYVFAEILF